MTNLILLPDEIASFQNMICSFYRQGGRRDFAWRGISDPYAVLVSEMMLQQTQTQRVVAKFQEWMEAYPTVQDLAQASLSDVLSHWVGLGYNRRAVFLQKAAQEVCSKWDGVFPKSQEELLTLPGIGPYTAGAVSTFAFNQPNVFIETNIRSVYIWYFFGISGSSPKMTEVSSPKMTEGRDGARSLLAGGGARSLLAGGGSFEAGGSGENGGEVPMPKVDDKELIPLIQQTLVTSNPRDWYYALMDYGAELKKKIPNPSRSSRHYAKQSRFEGSLRQARGAILRQISLKGAATLSQISREEKIDMARLEKAAQKLIAEKMLSYSGELYRISD